MALLTKNQGTATIKEAGADNLKIYDVGADVHIWHNGFVGLDPAGNAKAFQVGDVLAGIAYEEANNTAPGNAIGDKTVRVHTQADFVMALSGAAKTDGGRSVFAVTDNQNDVSFIGHPDAYVGQFMQLTGTKAIVRIANPGKMPSNGDNDRAVEVVLHGHEPIATGASTATFQGEGVTIQQVVGLGVTTRSASGGFVMQFDATSEAATASIQNPGAFDGALGMTLECDIHAETWAGSACDLNFGFTDEIGAAETADLDTALNTALFHQDGASDTILAESDFNGATEVTPIDTTIDNVTTAAAWKRFKVIVRASGIVEFWIDKARVLASTVFAVDPAIITYRGLVNLEKTSGTNTAVVMLRRLRIAGVAAA